MLRPSILVIDDNTSTRARLVKILAAEFRGVNKATNASEALSVAEKIHPDIVILDLIRSRSGGRALARVLKSRDPETTIVAIAATSADLPSLAVGEFTAALAQPFEPDELIDLVFGLCPPEWLGVAKPPNDSWRRLRRPTVLDRRAGPHDDRPAPGRA